MFYGFLGCLGLNPPGLREVLLEGFYVEEVGKGAVEGVAALLEGDPLFGTQRLAQTVEGVVEAAAELGGGGLWPEGERSEEHTSELQSRQYLVCRLLLEKKNK